MLIFAALGQFITGRPTGCVVFVCGRAPPAAVVIFLPTIYSALHFCLTFITGFASELFGSELAFVG
jgi:hypothetical protein